MKQKAYNRRMRLLDFITDWLRRMAVEMDISVRKHQTDDLQLYVSILKDILNLLHGWDLIITNLISEESSAFDLVDMKRSIAVHITMVNDVSIVWHALDQYSSKNLETQYERLIILIISNQQISADMKGIRHVIPNNIFLFDGLWDIWNIPWLIEEMKGLDTFRLEELAACLEDLNLIQKRPSFLLPSVPKASSTFVPGSRDNELHALIKLLENSNTIYLCGIAGIGKTELAIQLANMYAPLKGAYFLSYQLPLDSSGEAMRETILAADFDGYRFLGVDGIDREQEYRERLEILRSQYQGALLIIDGFNWPGKNVTELREEQSFQDLIDTGVTLVFTTRNNVKKSSYKVGRLCDEAILQLMHAHQEKGYADQVVSNEQLLNLARGVECHTKGVELIVKALNCRPYGLSPKKMLELIQTGNLDSVNIPTSNLSVNGISSSSSLVLSFQRMLDYSLLTEREKTVLHCAALFPEGINVRFFRKVLQQELWQGTSLLIKQNMMIQNRDKISIPSVVRIACQIGCKDLNRYCSTFLDRMWDDYPVESRDMTLALQIAKGYDMAAIISTECTQYMVRAARLYELTGNIQDALYCMQKKVSYLEGMDSPDQLSLAISYSDIGRLCSALGKAEQSLKYRMNELKILKKMLPADSPDIGVAYFDLGLTYQALGKHTEELESFQKALAVFKNTLSDDHPDLARANKYTSKAFLKRKHASMRRRAGDQPKSNKRAKKK